MKGPFCRLVTVLFFLSLFLVFPKSALAAVVTWDGGGADGTCGGGVGDGNKWSCGLNWSTDSVPTSSDVATFGSGSTKNATIDSGFAGSVSGVDINTGYTGTITASRSLTIGTGDYDQADGTFTSGSQTIDFDDGFNLTGGTFNASSGTMTIAGQFTDGAGTFSHNSGTVTFDPSTLATITITCDATTFNAVNISSAYSNQQFAVASGCTVPIAGTNPTLTGGTISNSGTISITGNPTFSISYTSNTGAVLSMTGNTVTISKNLTLTAGTFPSGVTTLNMTGGNLDNSGSLLPNGIDLSLTTTSNPTMTCGTVTFNSVTITKHASSTVTIGSTCVFPLAGTNPTVLATLNNSGTVNVTGNLTATGYTANSGSVLTSTGTSMTITGSMTLTAGTFPSGITTLSVGANLSNSGNLLPNSIALTLSGSSNLNCGTATFASIAHTGDTTTTITLGSDCTTGDLTSSGTGSFFANPSSARTMYLTGNLSHQSTGGTTTGGANLTLEFTGSAAQTLNTAKGTFIHILRINKTGSNAAKLTSAYTNVSQTCTVVEGVFDTNGNSFDCGSTFTVQDGGTLTLAGAEPMDIPTLDSGSTVTYKGDGDASADSFQIRDWTYKNLTAAFTDTNDTLSAPTADTLTTSEVGYWKMDEGSGTVVDSSSNNNTATATNATFTTTVPPIDGSNPYAMDFDGSGDYLDMGNNLNLAQNVGAFSIGAFIRKDSNSGVDQIFGLSTGDSTSDSRAALATTEDEIICSASAGDAEAVQSKTTSATNLQTGVWYHVICTIDYASDTITIYLNGVSQSLAAGGVTFTATATSDTASQRSSIGIDEDKVGNDYDGQIDEVRVYTKTLAQNEIQAMSAGFTTLVVGSRTVSNNLTISSGTLVSPTTLNVGGNFSNSATFTHNSGTVTLNGTSGTKTLTSGGASFYNLTINDGGGTLTTQLQDALDVNNNLTITGGTLDTKSGGNYQINVGGTWSNSDTFTARSGTVVLDGGSQTVSGSTTFNSLTKNVTSAATLTLPAGSTQTMTGTMNLSGTSGNLLSLRSSSSPTQAKIDPQGTRTISYLDVKDNNNINSTTITTAGFNITDSGNNTGWGFNSDPTAPTSLGGANLVNGNWGTDSTPTFTFTLADSDADDTVKYRIQIDDSSDFSSAVVDYTSALAAQGSTSFTVGQAAGSGSYTTGSSGQTLTDGSYYWRVKTIDDASAESAYTTANSGAIAFKTDTSAPSTPSLDSPGNNSYTNSTRPGFRWGTSTDTGSGLSSYSLEIDNGDSGDFSITGIPISRTTDYETNTYLIKYEGFSDSDANNNYITVYTKSSVDWSSGNNNGLLKEGKRGWTVKAYDNAGAEASGSRNLFVDLTTPSINVTTVNSQSVSSGMTVSDRTPILVGTATDQLGNAIASSPKEISIKIDKIVVGKKTTTYQNVVSTTISVPKIYWTSDDSLITDNTLQKSAKYYPFSYKVASRLALGDYRATIGGSDQAGNGSSGQTFTFKISSESAATEIFGVRAVGIATNSAQIVWYTNHPATSRVNYGISADYGKSVSSSLKVESHSMLLTGLSPGTGYYFEVISTGKTTASDSLNSFITLAFITPTPSPTPTSTPTPTPSPTPTPDIIEELITLISTPAADLVTFVSTPAAILGSYISSASASFLPMVSGMTLTTLDLLEEVVEQIAAVKEEIIASPPAAAAVQTSSVVTTAAATVALVAIGAAAVHAGVVAATIVPPAASLILSPHLIERFASGVQHFVATFLTGLGLIKRRRKSEGMVINAVDDTPIANANLLFYSPSGNLKITFTDGDGRFDVKAASDTYQIKAQKAGYVFPSLTLTTPENEKYAHIYRPGDNYEIVGEPLYEIAIPMDPQESPVALVRMFLRVKNYLSYVLIKYHLLISLTGAVSSGIGAWVYPNNLTYFALVVYSTALILSLRHTLMRETWGKVFDASGKPMVNMLLRLYRQLPDRLDLYTSLTTDREGRYLITPEPGDYVLQAVDADGKVVKSRSLIINPGHPRLDEKITVR